MSDNWLILIPRTPDYVPSKDAQELAVALFTAIAPEADEIVVEISEHPRFIDCGSNFTKIICPFCRREMGVGWWRDWRDQECSLNFQLKPATLPCCGEEGSLSGLHYDWPQGFARFSLEAMNPNIQDIPKTVESEFEAILGCRARKIWRHI